MVLRQQGSFLALLVVLAAWMACAQPGPQASEALRGCLAAAGTSSQAVFPGDATYSSASL